MSWNWFLLFWNPLDWMRQYMFGGLIDDIGLIIMGFKLVILLFIISFVKSRFGGGPVVTVLVFVLGYVMLFTDYFVLFGPIMFIYLFIIFGFTSIIFDLAIAKPWKKMKAGGTDTHFKEAAERHDSIRKFRGRI